MMPSPARAPISARVRSRPGPANLPGAASRSFQNRLAAVAKHVRAALVRRRIYNQTARELNALTDRELADLGIHRADIPQIALEAARGK